MDRKYAIIKNLKVINIFISSDEAFVEAQRLLCDYLIDVTELLTCPSIAWSYNATSGQFTAPVDSREPLAIVEEKIKAARIFGSQLITKYSSQNVLLGITQSGKTNIVRKTLAEIVNCLQTGSLYDAINEARAVPEENKDATFINNSRLLDLINDIEAYLGLPKSSEL